MSGRSVPVSAGRREPDGEECRTLRYHRGTALFPEEEGRDGRPTRRG